MDLSGGAAAAAVASPPGADKDKPFPVPQLRDDLELLPAAPDKYGMPGWSIYDPVRNRYFRIGHVTFELLVRWYKGRSDWLIASVSSETVFEPTPQDVIHLMVFLRSNGLLNRDDDGVIDEFERIDHAGKPPVVKWMVHKYLFFRIPLVRPDRFLDRTQWMADFVASPWVERTIIIFGLIGLYLVTRSWDTFVTTFQGFANVQGLIWLGITMTCTKVLHELGHAYTANRYDCRVPTMGVAFLVMYPVLYTDVTDAWRVTSRELRLRIGVAGIRVELALAMLATFLWNFVPEGPVRSAVFLVATASWITTLLINLSPFLRFDGYYITSDLLDLPNLHNRSFAVSKWWLREKLFKLNMPAPEPLTEKLKWTFIIIGFSTIIYRFFLFLGIALLVYHFFFKVLGIILFAVEIWVFIAAPAVKEIVQWFKLKEHVGMNRNVVVSALITVATIWLFIQPWSRTVTAPAIWSGAHSVPIITDHAGQLVGVNVKDGQTVRSGDVLFRLEAPDFESSRINLLAKLNYTNVKLAQAKADRKLRGEVGGLEQNSRRLKAEIKRLDAKITRLSVIAPIDGILRDVPDNLQQGTWVPEKMLLGRTVSGPGKITAYVGQEELSQLFEDSEVKFIPSDPGASAILGRLVEIDQAATETLDGGYLASDNGGDIAARADKNGIYEPLLTVYRITAEPENAAEVLPDYVVRGTLHIEGTSMSYFERMWRLVAAVLLRESGF